MTAAVPLTLFTLRWARAENGYRAGWVLFKGQRRWDGPFADKDVALKFASRRFRAHARAKQPVSLQVRARNGRIEEERTYPRSRDPRKSRG